MYERDTLQEAINRFFVHGYQPSKEYEGDNKKQQ
jgi:hypothetical protein